MSTSLSLNNLLVIKKYSNGTFRVLIDRNVLHNLIESTPFIPIPYYEDNLNLLKKKNILRLDLTHPAFDHLWQPFSLQNNQPLANDNNNSIVRRQG